MIADLKPYPAYKDSGVEWLGEVPEHWEVRKLTRVARQETGHTPSRKVDAYWVPEECVIPWVSLADVWQLRSGEVVFIEETKERVSEVGLANSAARLLPKDTVILSRTASVGFPAILSAPMATTQDFAAWICGPTLRPKFLYFVLLAMRPEFRRLMMGSTHQTIYMPDIRAFRTPLPPVDEQTAITRFLDYTDRRIQRYIQAKQKLITLLEEQRQAIIHQAVTGQIDVRTGQPYTTYKNSGVEWLGEVPEHWGVRKLRRCVTVSGGMTPSMEVRRFWGGLIPWVTPKDMKRTVISDSSVRVTDSAIQETPLRLIKPPAVLIVVRGMILARRVPIASTTAPVTINQDMKALRTTKGTKAAFLARLLDSAQEAFMPLIDEAGHGTRRLPTERWRDLIIAIPPEEEQAAIVEHLDNTTAAIDAAISHTQRQIDLLSEYRTRLISDVVTGKLDVREAAARLPEVDPLETEDDSEESLEPAAELAEDLSTITAGA